MTNAVLIQFHLYARLYQSNSVPFQSVLVRSLSPVVLEIAHIQTD